MKWFFIHGLIWYAIVMFVRQIGVEIDASRRNKKEHNEIKGGGNV